MTDATKARHTIHGEHVHCVFDNAIPPYLTVAPGEVIEFVNEEIERLQKKIAEQHGYKLMAHRLELYGVPLKKGE